jgi:hypothetical protein
MLNAVFQYLLAIGVECIGRGLVSGWGGGQEEDEE